MPEMIHVNMTREGLHAILRLLNVSHLPGRVGDDQAFRRAGSKMQSANDLAGLDGRSIWRLWEDLSEQFREEFCNAGAVPDAVAVGS